ncbi:MULTISPECIES: long-chain fatty acid--CoA ligase [unclassified Undibacterium]|uniref:long-chain-fatty-acid--CoA ligase n=1 Tax=unclassified Undibacterium TaxID=2630295 RepID=UPI002AC97A59|nr:MULTISPECIES: long-chain fatty acid--CoA ligase [unclassified Undibacterium]MEB0139790.1 long-chain fatty acid--CoA ligase [Undibacterium sp. CCC2.1]MEB0170502.1 long-chain fatty acid--CoA ligase [Undibacterium sp. CCC1.1]MEB0174443.1 long-chain fatty acid--CoA ligase [Undibacterium sp. CCC3.4]MEB0213760.1 long-chain fatty acid--CoA ligase [Undibacterium sp. 5I2]WPX43923.1 long-chain fatty acid--CoA ligase [Undibacterium sp. CCC3.4]
MSTAPWTTSYPAGVRWDADLPTSSVPQLLHDAVAKWPLQPALEFMGQRLSYRQLQDMVDRATCGLQRLGLKPGMHVGLFLPNTPHYVICFFAILQAGAIVVNYSPLDAAQVLKHKIEDSHTDFLVTLDMSMLYPQMAQMLGTTRLQKLIVGNLAEMSPQPAALHAHLSQAGQLCSIPSDAQHVLFADLIDNDGAYQMLASAQTVEQIAVLQYTGGTTGLPKGAMLTHANLTTACSQIMETTNVTPRVLMEGRERLLAVLPLFHIYALTVDMLFGIRLGAEIILHSRFDVDAVVKDLTNKKITIFPGVPTMYTAIIHYPDIGHYDLSALKFCNSGGAPLPGEVLQQFQILTGCHLLEGWGMTETSPTGTFTPLGGVRKPGSCGLPTPGIDFKFESLDAPGQYVAAGERGEICVAGANVMRGYWNKPEANQSAFTADGYFRTGDVGYMDSDGYVYIVDRTKDMILSGGYNVYPRNIEEAIYQHPAVAEVSVIGIPDAYRGQAAKAFIKLKTGQSDLSFEQLKAFLQDKLGKHEMPQAIEIRAELPKTPVGKLSKKELYDEEAKKRSAA